MAVWPDKFKITRESFTESFSEGRSIRSKMDVGPDKIRRRTVIAIKEITFVIVVSLDDYEDFEEFYLANDAFVFEFKHPRTGKILNARFKDVPKAVLNETFYKINISLEIIP